MEAVENTKPWKTQDPSTALRSGRDDRFIFGNLWDNTLEGCEKSRFERKKRTAGAEARTNLQRFTARLNIVPFPKPARSFSARR
jgi:hypothetical protein